MKKQITTDTEALTMALYLAITAPTEEKSLECMEMAFEFASGLSDVEIEACKSAAHEQAFEVDRVLH